MNNALKKRIIQISPSIEQANRVEKSPVVSVLVQTYNQEATIAQCLQSILAQKTNFDYEILIGEDNSQDRTRDICHSFAKKHPTKIRLFTHTGDDKIYYGDEPTGRFNYYTNIINARGKYLAICEGDDHWNGTEKLQKQVDAFEADPTIGICFHSVYINHLGKVFEDNADFTTKTYNKIPDKSNITYKTFLEFGNFIHTPSTMFRNEGFIEALSQLKTEPRAIDFLVLMIASSRKRVHKIKGRHATYRSGIGVWSSLPKWERVLKWRTVLKAILDFEFLDKNDRQILSDKLNYLDADVLRLMKNWTITDQLKHLVKIKIITNTLLMNILLAYRKSRH